MKRLTICLSVLLVLSIHTAFSDEKKTSPTYKHLKDIPHQTIAPAKQAPYIKNHSVSLSLCEFPHSPNKWSLVLKRKSQIGREEFTARLIGDFKDQKEAALFRSKHSVFYPFQNGKLEVRDIKAEGSIKWLSFRVSFADHWIDSRVSIYEESPFVYFEVTGKSRDYLTPLWLIDYKLGPLFEIVTENHAKAGRTSSLKAKNIRGNSMIVEFKRYCAVFAPSEKKNDNYFCLLVNSPQKAQFTLKTGLHRVYLNSPFVLYGAPTPDGQKAAAPRWGACDHTGLELGKNSSNNQNPTIFKMGQIGNYNRDPHTIAHIAEGLWALMKKNQTLTNN